MLELESVIHFSESVKLSVSKLNDFFASSPDLYNKGMTTLVFFALLNMM